MKPDRWHNQMIGYIDYGIDSMARHDHRAALAALRGDPATAARAKGRADAQSRRVKQAIATAISDLAN